LPEAHERVAAFVADLLAGEQQPKSTAGVGASDRAER
jgi:hypothetical protein